jgi:hypothetical protein
VAPGDSQPSTGHNQFGFTFSQYGARVPGVIISPWISKNTVDHRLYDHSSVPATIEKLFDLAPMTKRDTAANTVLPLLSLAAARDDTPANLPFPAASPASSLLEMAISPAPWLFPDGNHRASQSGPSGDQVRMSSHVTRTESLPSCEVSSYAAGNPDHLRHTDWDHTLL